MRSWIMNGYYPQIIADVVFDKTSFWPDFYYKNNLSSNESLKQLTLLTSFCVIFRKLLLDFTANN